MLLVFCLALLGNPKDWLAMIENICIFVVNNLFQNDIAIII